MGLAQSQAIMATRLINKYGESLTWQKKPVDTADESKPWITTNAAMTPFPVMVAVLPASSLLAKLFAGSNIAKGGVRGVMVAPTGFTPDIADTVLRNGKTLALESLDPITVNGQIVVWKMEFKV